MKADKNVVLTAMVFAVAMTFIDQALARVARGELAGGAVASMI